MDSLLGNLFGGAGNDVGPPRAPVASPAGRAESAVGAASAMEGAPVAS